MFTFTWRVGDGSYFEQTIEADTLAKAKRRWARYWQLRQRDCSVFSVN